MPSDDIFGIENMSDDELARLVRQQLQDYETIDADSIVVTARDGVVHLSGRIGTESEYRIAERVLTDVIGVRDYRNEMVVDPIRRDLEPDAADDHAGDEAARTNQLFGERPEQTEYTASHLVEDLDARLYGTHNRHSAIERGTSYEAPDQPTPEGLSGMEVRPGEEGEDH